MDGVWVAIWIAGAFGLYELLDLLDPTIASSRAMAALLGAGVIARHGERLVAWARRGRRALPT